MAASQALVADRVKESTTTTGTGDITLDGTTTGFRTFTSVFSNGTKVRYCIVHMTTLEWEVGVGTLSASTTLQRTTVESNSAGTQPSTLSLSAGTKFVFCDASAASISSDVNITGGAIGGVSIVKRVTAITSSATPTPNVDTTDLYKITALATAPTFGAPTGTPVEGQYITIRIKDNGTARVLAWNAIYRASSDLDLPLTTTLSKTMYVGFMYNATDNKWDMMANLDNF